MTREQQDEEENKKVEILKKIRDSTGSTLRRLGAYILDILVISILFIITLGILQYLGVDLIGIPSEITLTAGGFIPTTASYLLTISLFSILHLLYFTILESDKILGSSPGKHLASLKVVDTYGKKISLSSSFTRNVFRLLWPVPFVFIEILPLIEPLPVPKIAYLGVVVTVIDLVLIKKDDQRIGDRVAGTYIVHEEAYEEIFDDYWKDQ